MAKIGFCQEIAIDRVCPEDFRRRRDAEHRDIRRDDTAELVQQVGMADQNGRAGVAQDVVDLLRLEMPVHRHAIGAEPHRAIGGLDEGDVVAHQDADAVALLHAELMQAARDARGAASDLGMVATAVAGGDAEIEGRFHGFSFSLLPVPHGEEREARLEP